MSQGGEKFSGLAGYFYTATLSFAGGVAVAVSDFWPSQLRPELIFLFCLFALVLVFAFSEYPFLRIVLIGAVFFSFACWRVAFDRPDFGPADLCTHHADKQIIRGRIADDVLMNGQRQSFVLSASRIGERAVSGRAMVFADPYPRLSYGDEIEIRGDIQAPEPYEGFAYERYLAKDGIYSIIYYPAIEIIRSGQGSRFWSGLYAVRHRIGVIIEQGLGEPESDIARATVLGEAKLIDKELQASFSLSGLSHVVAISGTHITIMAGLIYFLLLRLGLGRGPIFYISLVLILLFVIMADSPSSGVRSGIMAALLMYGVKIGRPASFSRVLIFSGFLMLLVKPAYLRDDIGFQLSFLSLFGLIQLYPLLDSLLLRLGIGNFFKLREATAISLAASLATAGIVAFHFGTVSVYGVLANILVLWASALILISLLIAIVLSFFVNGLAILFFLPARWLITYLRLVSDWVVSLPGARFSLEASFWPVFAYYLVLALLILWWQREE